MTREQIVVEIATDEVVAEVAARRRLQIANGYTPEHDDQHANGEILTDPVWGAVIRIASPSSWTEALPSAPVKQTGTEEPWQGS